MSLLSEDRVPFRLPPMQGMSDQDEADLFTFTGSVGPQGENRREDVIKAQMLLTQTGDLDPVFDVPTGWPSADLYRAITKLQKRTGKEPDGTILPIPPGGVDQNGVGETLDAARGEVGLQLAGQKAPSPSQVDAYYEAQSRFRNTVTSEPPRSSASSLPGFVTSDVPDAEPPQGKPGQQVAFLPAAALLPAAAVAARTAPQIPNLLRGLIGAASTAAALPLKGDEVTPRQTSPADHDHARTADPARPEEDKVERDNPPRRGRIVIAPDGQELNVPPLEPWIEDLKGQKRDFAESFHDQLAVEMLHHHGPRGSELTQQQLKDVVDACTAAAVDLLPGFTVTHVAGALDPYGEPVPEEQMWKYDENGNRLLSGFRRPDFSILLARRVALMLRGNSYDSYADGRPKPREENARNDIQSMSPDEPFLMIEKLRNASSREEMKAEADKLCREILTKVRDNLENEGEWDQPQPEEPATYKGPANRQAADDKRSHLNPQPRPRQSGRR